MISTASTPHKRVLASCPIHPPNTRKLKSTADLLPLIASAPAIGSATPCAAQSAPPQVIAVKLNQVKGVKPGKRVAGLSNWVRRLPTPHAARVVAHQSSGRR